VIGFFLQQRELRNNNRAIRLQYEQMRKTAEHAEIQARAIAANELHQRQETLLLVADRVHRQLGAVVGFGTEIRTRHSETIMRTFERLLNSTQGCDPDGIITDALLGSGHGTLYQIIQERKANPPS
jgi:hypothetical protein